MTFKELLAIEHPDKIRPSVGGGCVGCPKDYGYEKGRWCDTLHPVTSCEICWNREMRGEKEMTKHEMTKQFLAAQEAVSKAKKALEKATDDLTRVVKMIEEQVNSKPKLVYKSGWEIEITKYTKYSDKYIEFETIDGRRGRYIELGASKTYTYPNNKMSVVLESHIGHIFEMYDYISHKYTEANLIDHIELLEGVDEYDKAREL